MLQWAIGEFARHGIDSPEINARELLSFCLGLPRRDDGLPARLLSSRERALFQRAVERRLGREPLQQIIGHWGFWSLDLMVTPDVLTPRPETELLVQEALGIVGALGTSVRILDIGTGSGNIAIAMAREVPLASVIATDISPPALAVARENVLRYRLEKRIDLFQGDLFHPVAGQRFDMILSNPPYVPSDEIAGLEPEVRDFEPRAALDGGRDGMDYLRAIIAGAADHLLSGGRILLETGNGQAEAAADMMRDKGLSGIRVLTDLRGIPRVVSALHG